MLKWSHSLVFTVILTLQTTDDLTNLDKKRKEEFKKYEMNKEHEYREKLAHADKEEAEKIKKEHEEQLKRHKDHEKLNHPVSCLSLCAGNPCQYKDGNIADAVIDFLGCHCEL